MALTAAGFGEQALASKAAASSAQDFNVFK
jgi:hypothetical protein